MLRKVLLIIVCTATQLIFAATPLIQIGKGEKPIIDGKLNEWIWNNCAEIFPFIENNGKGLAESQTKVKLYYDKSALYVSFICNEQELDKIKTDHIVRDRDVWCDDAVEIHLVTPDGNNDYHVLVNSAGITDDRKGNNYAWDPELDIATFKNKEEKKWGLEIAIPWKELGFVPAVGDSIAMNFSRMRQVSPERSGWNATYGSFNTPSRFGQIVFDELPVVPKILEFNNPIVGANKCNIKFKFPGNEKIKILGNGNSELLVNPKTTKPIEFIYVLGLENSEIILKAKHGNKILWRQVLPGEFGSTPHYNYLRSLKEKLNCNSNINWRKNNLFSVLISDAEKAESDLINILNKTKENEFALTLEKYNKLNDNIKNVADRIASSLWVVYEKICWDNIDRRELPKSLDDTKEISVNSLTNEYSSGSFIISNMSNEPINLRISQSDFQTKFSKSKEVMFEGIKPDLFVVDWQDTKIGLTIADPLIPLNNAGRIDIPIGESREVWFTIPPLDLPSGNYHAGLSIQTIGNSEMKSKITIKDININLKIAPVRITTIPDFQVYNWDYAKNESYLKDLYEHKVNNYLVSTSLPIPKFDENGNNIGEIDYTEYDKLLRLKYKYAKKANGKILFSYGVLESFDNKIKKEYGFKYRSKEWDKAFTYTYKNWLNHIKKIGLTYDDFILQIWDEALREEVEKAIEGGKLLREIDPNVKLVMDGSQTVDVLQKLDPYIDIWIPHYDVLVNAKDSKGIIKFYKNVNEPVYGYCCAINMKSQPINDYYRLKPWYAANFGLDGVFYWAYNSWRNDPWNDFDGKIEKSGQFYADCGVVYDGINGPITSKRWEASREGIEDWQLIRLIKNLAENENNADDIKKNIESDIKKVLLENFNNSLADDYHNEFINISSMLVKTNPLEVSNIETKKNENVFGINYSTNRISSSKLFYKYVGTNKWMTLVKEDKINYNINVPISPETKIDWIIVSWDKLGHVTNKYHIN